MPVDDQVDGTRFVALGMAEAGLDPANPIQDRGNPQVGCVSFTLDAKGNAIKLDPARGGGTGGASVRILTNNHGDRYRNAQATRTFTVSLPAAAGLAPVGKTAVGIKYNAAIRNNNAETYAMLVDPHCNPLTAQTLIEAKTNDNCSEDNQGMGEDGVMPGGWNAFAMSCPGNGENSGWAVLTQTTLNAAGSQFPLSIAKVTDLRLFANDVRRNRPNNALIPAIGGTLGEFTALHCGTRGNTQPPRGGVQCYVLGVNTNTGSLTKLVLSTIARPNETTPGLLATQIQFRRTGIQPNGDGIGYYVYTELGRRRRGGDGKAQVTPKMGVLTWNAQGITMLAPPANMVSNIDGTHLGACAMRQGNVGNAAFMVGSYNGNSFAPSAIVHSNISGNSLTKIGAVLLGNAAVDSAWLGNLYFGNPTIQGRVFTSCTQVMNPATNEPWMLVAANTRTYRPDLPDGNGGMGRNERKLGLQIVAYPLTSPDAAGVIPDVPPVNGNGTPIPSHLTGCGCQGGASSQGTFALVLLGLVIVGLRRRRR
jgi:MYXO-CTERM domain-containing protein